MFSEWARCPDNTDTHAGPRTVPSSGVSAIFALLTSPVFCNSSVLQPSSWEALPLHYLSAALRQRIPTHTPKSTAANPTRSSRHCYKRPSSSLRLPPPRSWFVQPISCLVGISRAASNGSTTNSDDPGSRASPTSRLVTRTVLY